MSKLLAIAVDAPLRQLFDYRPPIGVQASDLQPGIRLWVPFGRRRVVGVLVKQLDRSTYPESKLRPAHSVIDSEPIIEAQLLALLCWSAEYYRHPPGEVIAAALPAALRAGRSSQEQVESWSLTKAAFAGRLPALGKRAIRQIEMVEFLREARTAVAAELEAIAPHWREHLRNLEKRGWVERQQVVRPDSEPEPANRSGQAPLHRGPDTVQRPRPTAEQEAAIDAVAAAQDTFKPFLLHGVTGSGKTEVYLRAIETVVNRGRQALVLVPEIALTPQLVSRFADRFEGPLAVMHSSLPDQARLQNWRAARTGQASIVIGTRSAIFAPLARPGLIVVDEEHDASYKQQEGFRYSARDLALVRAQRLGIPVVLGSATPSLETLELVNSGRATTVHLPNRVGGARPPGLRLIDLRRHAQTHGIATPTLLTIKHHLDAGGQVLLYLNRRGYSPTLFCPSCGWVAPCPRCDARLTVHQRDRRLCCHHCGGQQGIPETCPNCGEAVKPVGQGTQRIEETMEQLFPGMPMARIDRDSVRRRGALEEALGKVTRGEARLLIGTQMLTKGHHFPQVSLVVILNADQGLFGTDFRASERLAQTIVQVAGRAGRAERPGEVLIQTEYPEHPLLTQLVSGGHEAFAHAALRERAEAQWPPFARIAVLRAEATDREAPIDFLDKARAAAESLASAEVELLGPATAPMERRAGHYRAQLLLHARTHAPLQRLFARWLCVVEKMPEARKVRWSLDVDPLELF